MIAWGKVRSVSTCAILSLALVACGWNKEMDNEALGILGELLQILGIGLWFIAIWAPLVVYYRTYFPNFFRSTPILQRHAYAVGIALLLPVFITWPMNPHPGRPWGAIALCLIFAAAIAVSYYVLLGEREERQRRLDALEVTRLCNNIALLPSPDTFAERFNEALAARSRGEGLPDISPTNTLYSSIVKELYEQDIIPTAVLPVTPTDYLKRYDDIETLLSSFEKPLLDCFMQFRRLVPPQPSPFSISACDAITIDTVDNVLGAFTWNTDVKRSFVLGDLHRTLNANALHQGVRQLKPKKNEEPQRVWPLAFEGTVREAATTYFNGTPLLRLFTAPMYLPFPDETRFEAQWVIARQGSGKTQLLQTQIASDLDRVAAGEASIVVIDSQPFIPGGFLHNIATLKQFAPGQPLADKLILLRPAMQEDDAQEVITPSLNIFDVGQHNPSLSARDRQIAHASAIDMITFSLSGTSPQQDAMIRFLVQLAVNVQGATIDTLADMLRMRKGPFLEEYGSLIEGLSKTVRDYFNTTFFDDEVSVTKRAVVRRLAEIMSNTTFERMFSNQRNSINLRQEIDAGNVILIHTDKGLLREQGCELFGRFFISLLLQATLTRTSKKPVFCYLDEAHDYISNEENAATLIDQARKQKVGFVFSHQRLNQIVNSNVTSALDGCAIKFASRNEGDSKEVARSLRTDEAFVRDMPKLHFACFIRDVTTRGAVRVPIKWGLMEKHMEHMTDAEFAQVRQRMRDLYCGPASPPSQPPRPPSNRPSVTDAEYVIVSHADHDGPDKDGVY